MTKNDYEINMESLYKDTVNEISIIEQKDPSNKHLPLLKERLKKIEAQVIKIRIDKQALSQEEKTEVLNFEQQAIANEKNIPAEYIRMRKATTMNYESHIIMPTKDNAKEQSFADVLNNEMKRKY